MGQETSEQVLSWGLQSWLSPEKTLRPSREWARAGKLWMCFFPEFMLELKLQNRAFGK